MEGKGVLVIMNASSNWIQPIPLSLSDVRVYRNESPLKKTGIYCFAPVGRSVDQAKSDQRLLTSLLYSYQICTVDAHMVKGQCHTSGLCKNIVRSIFFDIGS